MTEPAPRKSDLGVRVASAVVMVAVAGTALWLGGWLWTVFVMAIAVGVLWEWRSLAFVISLRPFARLGWLVSGIAYITLAAALLIQFRAPYDGIYKVSVIIMGVISVDIGAYFVGRAIGGPKIAPSISPSKTWAGLAGGAIGSTLFFLAISWAWPAGLCAAYVASLNEPALQPGHFTFDDRCDLYVPSISQSLPWAALLGSLVTVVAQTGDFFESWMKRRAGVKDSGILIPGHGGLFDRVDGLLAVLFVVALINFPSVATFMLSGI